MSPFLQGSIQSGQTGTAMMANGAAVAASSRAAMIRNHWGGKVARCAFMAGMCADSRFGKMILFKGLEPRPKALIQLAVSS
jgi:hypothetical protein